MLFLTSQHPVSNFVCLILEYLPNMSSPTTFFKTFFPINVTPNQKRSEVKTRKREAVENDVTNSCSVVIVQPKVESEFM